MPDNRILTVRKKGGTPIRDNLIDRIAVAEREGWLGEGEGLRVTLTSAEAKLAQIDRRRPGPTAITLGPTRTASPTF